MSDDNRDDPFADLDTETDRDGNPFEELDELSDEDEPADSSTESESRTQPKSRGGESDSEDEFANVQRLSDALEEKEPDEDVFDFDAPSKAEFLEDVDEEEIAAAVEDEIASEVQASGATTEQDADNPFAELEDESGGIEQQDEEEILEALDNQDGDPFDDEDLFTEADVTTVDANRVWESLDEDESFERSATEIQEDVSKHRFCKQCEYFAEPPGSHCTHETAEITQYLDMDTVRVLNCPVVARERQIENE